MSKIDCAFYGFLAADADARIAQAGKQCVRLRVGVGKDQVVQWLSVAAFGKAAEIAADLRKDDRIYCEGTIKLDACRGSDGGVDRYGLLVATSKIEKLTTTTSEWAKLRDTLSNSSERVAGTVPPRRIGHIFPDGEMAWRYASEPILRREGAAEIIADIRRENVEAARPLKDGPPLPFPS
jgi:single-stranded DNA-binding protein